MNNTRHSSGLTTCQDNSFASEPFRRAGLAVATGSPTTGLPITTPVMFGGPEEPDGKCTAKPLTTVPMGGGGGCTETCVESKGWTWLSFPLICIADMQSPINTMLCVSVSVTSKTRLAVKAVAAVAKPMMPPNT
eukprot:CAMPEP_0177400658 /NCGR_PEP_ID=MMETSP0368-20130122/59216_1 /TAXON_ID=447022 ORGANISM="Scrippsiella hangoei-like, Strain SHHI-4" /NCGR_SAMPLE_ID=MMETSP0368 /ASSEMBLY_ACC=CAM_ASM_000363 /LENGTH=133 /DNA_ID=CAMNT_0018868151 /DNA_START=189 /DNA_END=590 /DNA_ORIENTATION=+